MAIEPLSILALDDDTFILNMLGHLLRSLNQDRFRLFESAVDAIEYITKVESPDLVLLDINMPDIDGIQFIRLLKEQKFSGSLVFMSGEDELMHQTLLKLASLHGLNVIGSIYKPLSQYHLQQVLTRADKVLQSQNNHEAYSQQQKCYSIDEIAKGIEAGEFVNYYQPKVCLISGNWVGVEALVRWLHPDDGVIGPAAFISKCEEFHMIGQLTEQVIENICRDHQSLPRDQAQSFRCAVNLSMDDISNVDFTDWILQRIRGCGLSSKSFVLEVTESRLVQNLIDVLDVLARLRLNRFKLSIDDFGTGHSSMLQLRDMPFDQLKIDRAFVHEAYEDARRNAILRTTLSLSTELDMEVVAEGIETVEDWRYLQAKGCEIGQGFFIARPMPLEQLYQWSIQWQERVQDEQLYQQC